jgi:hypothetical protein
MLGDPPQAGEGDGAAPSDTNVKQRVYQTAMRHRPYYLKGAGCAFNPSLPHQQKVRGVERRQAPKLPRPLAGNTARPFAIRDAAPLGAPHAGPLARVQRAHLRRSSLRPRDRSSGPGPVDCGPPSRGFRPVRPSRVQPGYRQTLVVGSGGCPEPPGAAADEAATAGAASRSISRRHRLTPLVSRMGDVYLGIG